ncbi:MAG: hypothetical protein ACK5WO_03915 [Cyclobacteriaceae bacterium]|jgi:hypothetical protein|nr:hypothetical protein [Flammeovirgaceae bacterium]
MKHIWIIVLALGFALVACQSKEQKTEEAAEEQIEWAEMDAYHMLMAEAFHPYKDSSNLAPAKAGAAQLAAEAVKWAAAPLPAKVDNEQMRAKLQRLKFNAGVLSDKVQMNASDAEIGQALTTIHDDFHAIMEAWHGGGHEHGKHKH